MGLYLGSNEKLKIHFNNKKYGILLFSEIPIVNGVLLKSADGFILKDANGLYLTAKGSE